MHPLNAYFLNPLGTIWICFSKTIINQMLFETFWEPKFTESRIPPEHLFFVYFLNPHVNLWDTFFKNHYNSYVFKHILGNQNSLNL